MKRAGAGNEEMEDPVQVCVVVWPMRGRLPEALAAASWGSQTSFHYGTIGSTMY